jgi:hypothetical protein
VGEEHVRRKKEREGDERGIEEGTNPKHGATKATEVTEFLLVKAVGDAGRQAGV